MKSAEGDEEEAEDAEGEEEGGRFLEGGACSA
jgi:hypothetical protein